MRSGNGRHRRPRQAPALFVAAGVTGAGIAIPLLGATGAQAADADTWDRVAQCESGGVWSANKDNGYYGGLQLTLQMWEEYGGTAYAERPDLASRSQQIAVGEKLLSAKGPQAFPRCADLAKLTDAGDEGAPDVDPGEAPGRSGGYPAPAPSLPGETDPTDETPAPSPSLPGETGGDDGTDGSTDHPDEPDESATPTPPDSGKPGDGGDRGTPDESAEPTSPPTSGKPGKGKHRGQPDQREGGHDRDRDNEAGHPSRGGDDARDSKPDAGGKHRVQPGDSLSQIAADQDVRGGWPALYDRNRDLVGDNPDLIHPGQNLNL